MKLTRSNRNLINDAIKNMLNKFVVDTELEERCCYFVKNINPETNICFVHRFSESDKSFQNLDLSILPDDVKEDDVLILQDGKYIVHEGITNELLNLKKRILISLENSAELFKEEGKEYVVCDKSDDDITPKMSLRIEETGQEFWGIDIDKEFYHCIKYGSKVRYQDGKYVLCYL